jgi:hypothetical protein
MEVLFALTVYRDGQIRVEGKAWLGSMPEVLRTIAEAIESGATVLSEEAPQRR